MRKNDSSGLHGPNKFKTMQRTGKFKNGYFLNCKMGHDKSNCDVFHKNCNETLTVPFRVKDKILLQSMGENETFRVVFRYCVEKLHSTSIFELPVLAPHGVMDYHSSNLPISSNLCESTGNCFLISSEPIKIDSK